ncbi:YitT family protein [Pedobacter sp. MR2016-19]|uniref:YitT family protein n=1 Tax=unclassified Pedobacter TaxID=2628915 RepID=UPI0010454AE3|nr:MULTISPECIES: YitT family protein [unclassified Pedobacter]MBE5319066.1 YitT family protein [Pedobacter sp. MR2016-19]QXU40424.1 YitT family protein [Pedobacter sp. D749]
MNRIKNRHTRFIKEILLIIAGVTSACFGLKSFLMPSHFIDGGVTGISLLLSTLTGWNLSYLIAIINIPFVILGYRQIGKGFAIKTAIAIAALSLALIILPFQPITHDKLLIAFFGGLFLGGGIGLAMRGGCVIDGTEVLALYISKNSILTVGNIILILNIIIFAFAAYFLNIETALYAILTYLSASSTIDFIVNGIEQYTGVTIISEHQEAIKGFIINEMKRGVTIYKGEGGYGEKKDIDIIFTVVTKLEMSKLQTAIRQIDQDAFVIQQQIADLKGGVVKRHALH